MRDFARYLCITLCISLGALPVIAVFCYAMDPYRVFGVPVRPGWNDIKGSDNDRLHAAYALRRTPVENLLLGNSRLRAFDPSHPVFAGAPTLDVRLAGTDVWELEHFFHHALAVAPIRRVLLLVDFVNFNATAATGSRPAYLVGPGEDADGWGRRIRVMGPLLVSLNGLEAAVQTLRASVRGEQNGAGRLYGTRQLFRLAEQGFARVGGAYTPGLTATYAFQTSSRPESSFAPFARILTAAHDHEIDLRLVMSPSHARMWQVVDSLGLWGEWETWKRRVVAENERVAVAHGHRPFPMWDFSGFNTVTTEPVPPVDGEPMRLYDETSHYRREVGDLVLWRVFGDRAAGASHPDFGVLLTSANLDAHLASIRAARDEWQRANSGEVREVEAQIF